MYGINIEVFQSELNINIFFLLTAVFLGSETNCLGTEW